MLAVFFVGLAHIAFLPPWEGFDEYAHWSSIQQIADTGTVPRLGQARMGSDLARYPGPLPYATGMPPFETPGQVTYRNYKGAAGNLNVPVSRSFSPSSTPNWQSQHPPLFYALMAPVYHLVQGSGWLSHLFVLRLVAWLIAFAGLVVATLATATCCRDRLPNAALLTALFPFLVPQFFPEMARLGNDALCLVIASGIWFCLLRITVQGGSRNSFGLLGLLTGLGLLTKGFFLPIGTGAMVYLVILSWRGHAGVTMRRVAMAGAIAVGIGSIWYVANLIQFGSMSGFADFASDPHKEELLAGLRDHFSIPSIAHGFAVIGATFYWGGTWSIVHPNEVVLAGGALLTLAALSAWVVRPTERNDAWLLPVCLILPMVAGLAWHTIASLAMNGRVLGTPGWYLHILVGPFAYLLALGWTRLTATLLAFSVPFSVYAWSLQLSLFSGCSTKGNDKIYSFADAGCFIDLARLDAVSFPWVGFGALFVAAICALLAIATRWADRTALQPSAS